MAKEFRAQEILFIYKSLLENLSKHWPRRKHYYGCCLVANSCLTLCTSMDYSPPSRFLCPWNFSGKNTGVSCLFLLQGIFPTQGFNPVSCIGRWILYHWAIREAPCTHFQANIPSAFWKEKPSPYRKAVLYINIFEKILWNKNCQWLYSQDIEKCERFNGKLILKNYLCCYCSVVKISV